MARQIQKLELTWYNKDRALIPTEHGKYRYSWVDPKDPRYCETRRLIIDETFTGQQSPKDPTFAYSDRSDFEPQTDNLLIHGDSGDVLEALTRVPELSEKYVRQVKCVYIDPPFNTSQAFKDYEDNLEHSIWLTMMRDRLEHLHKLLDDDGSIWVHLDDGENHRMRVLLDELFGPARFIAEISWEKVGGRDNRSAFSKSCDFIAVYAKTGDRTDFRKIRNLIPRGSGGAAYWNPDNDPRGLWTSDNFSVNYNPKENKREDQIYTLVTPAGRSINPPVGRCWLFTEPRYRELVLDNRVWFGERGTNTPRLKRFLAEVQDGLVPKTFWPHTEVGSNDSAKKELKKVCPGSEVFDTPKPEALLERIIQIATDPGDIVLDVFAGSGTTAAVAQKLGRRWVTCELLGETIDRYTLPRLEKVITDADPGGITSTPGERVAQAGVDLPNDMTPGEAQRLTSLLNKAIKGDEILKNDPTVETIKSMVKTTKTPTVINWRGGGGFRTAHLSPPCFDYDPEFGSVFLTDAADDMDVLTASIAAQLRIRLTPGDYFQGAAGNTRLFVTRTPVDAELVSEICSHLDGKQTAIIASTIVLDGAREEARILARGSKVLHVPHDLFELPEGDA